MSNSILLGVVPNDSHLSTWTLHKLSESSSKSSQVRQPNCKGSLITHFGVMSSSISIGFEFIVKSSKPADVKSHRGLKCGPTRLHAIAMPWSCPKHSSSIYQAVPFLLFYHFLYFLYFIFILKKKSMPSTPILP